MQRVIDLGGVGPRGRTALPGRAWWRATRSRIRHGPWPSSGRTTSSVWSWTHPQVYAKSWTLGVTIKPVTLEGYAGVEGESDVDLMVGIPAAVAEQEAGSGAKQQTHQQAGRVSSAGTAGRV